MEATAGKKILIVEDSRANMLVLTTFIERFGMTALQAETGQKAVDLFKSESPDIVLLDVVLPDMDGFEIARQIRDYEHGDTWTPIIFLSSLGKDEDIERGIAAGGDDYLLKPVSEIVLGAKIRAMQRIIQREKACQARIIPNSISESSGTLAETRCADETIRPSARSLTTADDTFPEGVGVRFAMITSRCCR